MFWTKTCFNTRRGAVAAANGTVGPDRDWLSPKGTAANLLAFVTCPRRTRSIGHETRRSHSHHLRLTQGINSVQGRHSRTGEAFKSNVDGNHD